MPRAGVRALAGLVGSHWGLPGARPGEGGILEGLGWKLESNFMVEGPADSALMKYLKKHHSVTGQIGAVHHLIDAVRRTQHHLLLISLHNLNLVTRKHQTNPNRGTATG